MKAFSYVRPTSVTEAVGQLTVTGRVNKALGGGMDLLDLMKEGLEKPDVLVSLSAVPGLDQIETLSTGGLRIGARVTLAKVASSTAVTGAFKALADAAGAAATPQIRNMATLGGNLLQRPRCWYFRKEEISCLKKGGSGCPGAAGENRYLAILGGGPCYAVSASSPSCALVALDAKLNLTGPSGSRQLPVASLYVSPSVDPTREHALQAGEVITSIEVGAQPAGTSSCFEKLKYKEAYDWAMAEVAVRLTVVSGKVSDSRIVMGGVAPIPWRATAAETLIKGQAMSAALAAQAAQVAVADAKPLSDNAYKVAAAKTMVEQMLLRAAGLG